MLIDNDWFAALAAAASFASGVALALNSHRRRYQLEHEAERKAEVKSWDNEGGNLATTPATLAKP